MSPTTCPECGVRCSIGSLVAREFDNTWVFEVYERMLSTRGVQVLPVRHLYNNLVGLTRYTFIAHNAHHQMDADSPDRHTDLIPRALRVQMDTSDRFM